MFKSKKIRFRYLLIGIIFGLFFPIAAIITDCFIFNEIEPGIAGVINRMVDNPIHFIILSAPLILGITFYYIGYYSEKQRGLNEAFILANAAMKDANELLDTFNYHVSHDLKTVLSDQLSLARMILKYVDAGDFKKVNEITQKLVLVSENGMGKIGDFLQISKEGYLTYSENRSIRIRDEIEGMLSRNNLEGKIQVSFKDTDFSTLRMKNKVFESIFLNLFTNSVKYCETDPKVQISLQRQMKGKLIIYEDNGIGLDSEKHSKKLFEPFQRIHTDMKKEGTGVGLFIVKKLIQAYSGKITMQSQIGKGVRIEIFFPYKK